MSKTVKLKDPNKAYFSPTGQVVAGNAVVEFEDPVPSDLLLKIANGALIETHEEPAPNTYRPPVPQRAEPRWATNPPAHLRVLQAPTIPEPEIAVPPSVQAEMDSLRARVAELEAAVQQVQQPQEPAEPDTPPAENSEGEGEGEGDGEPDASGETVETGEQKPQDAASAGTRRSSSRRPSAGGSKK